MSQLGLYKGRHYTGWVEDVERLKREKRFGEAEILLKGLVETVKAESKADGSYPAPWYFGELAALYHRQERYAEELALLEEFHASGGSDTRFAAAIRKCRLSAQQKAEVERQTPACPYCSAILEPVLRATRKCPHCGKKIVVRSIKGKRLLLTSEEADNRAREEISRSQREAALGRANGIYVSDSEFENEEKELRTRIGVALPNDVFWSLANKKAIEFAAKGDWNNAAHTYRSMADLLFQEGKDPNALQAQAELCLLRFRAGFQNPDTRLYVTGCGCAACSQEPRMISLADALERLPIPHLECRKKRCKCSLVEESMLPRERPRQATAAAPVKEPPAIANSDAVQLPQRKGFWSRLFGKGLLSCSRIFGSWVRHKIFHGNGQQDG